MNLCDLVHFATASLPLPDLKERLIEEWRHVDHCIIDRAVNQVNQ